MRYVQDDSYFKKIDTERKAYYLGFLYADGCVYEDGKNSKRIILQLHPDDVYILEQLLVELNSNRPIHVNNRGYVSINIGSTIMANDLINLGCIPRKSLVLKFPSEDIVPKHLLMHFIRGYMDGDGCISTYRRSTKNTINKLFVCEVKFIGTYDMLYGIKEFFNSSKNILINKHSPSSYQISFSGTKYREIVDILYKESTICLERKRNKWNEFVKYIDDKENKILEKLSKKVAKLDKYANYIGTYSLKELKAEFNISEIVKVCETEKRILHKEFMWLYLDEYEELLKKGIDLKANFGQAKSTVEKKIKEHRNVMQYDLSGNLINTWDTVSVAAEYYNTTAKAIRKVCIGERKTCCNFIWKYTDVIENKKNKAVRQYSLSGELIREWSNLREAALYYDVTFQAIERAINGKYKSCKGFAWSYGDI
jgi:hypothetical protein